MTATDQEMEQKIARCRLVLSVAAIAAMYVDPAEPLLSRWISLETGWFTMDFRLVIVMGSHLAYSLLIYLGLRRGVPSALSLAIRTTWVDVLFGVLIATFTEGITSPAYPFFAFAVVTTGLRAGLRQAIRVTAAGVVLYVGLIVLSARGSADAYLMRPVYLAITGYLVGYLGQQRLELQEKMRRLEVAEHRHRIGRELHDGYAQALAGINLRLEGARRRLRSDTIGATLTDLSDLQDSVNREYDDLRRYARSLAGVESSPADEPETHATKIRMHVEVCGPVDLVDQILTIAREGIRNVQRHARADTAQIEICMQKAEVRIHLDDDGVGLPGGATPWSIASRVKELGGQLQVITQPPGAHLLIRLPQS